MLREIQAFVIDRGDLTELVAMSAFGEMLLTHFEFKGVDPPDFLEPKLKEINREIKHKAEDMLTKQIRDAEVALEGYKTPNQRKAEKQAELAKLRTKMRALQAEA